MTVVICPECGDRGNLSCDGEGDKKYYKVQHSYDQGKVKGESAMYLKHHRNHKIENPN